MFKNLLRQDLHQNKEGKRDYRIYSFSMRERIFYILQGLGMIAVFAYFFYRSIFIFLIMTPGVFLYLKKKKQDLCKKQKEDLCVQFKEMLNSVCGCVMAGYSLENAFFEAYKDMVQLFGKESMIALELLEIKKGIRNSKTLEDLLKDFGRRSGIEDIQSFADILAVGKRSGGNLSQIIKENVTVIDEKTAVLQEIETMIRARKYEQKIMNIVPFVIILYINMTATGFFSVMYHNTVGIIVMSFCFFMYLLSVKISDKITDIRI